MEAVTASVPPHAVLLRCLVGLQPWLWELCPTKKAIALTLLGMGTTEQVALNVLPRKAG